jgi:hypothetical protein
MTHEPLVASPGQESHTCDSEDRPTVLQVPNARCAFLADPDGSERLRRQGIAAV